MAARANTAFSDAQRDMRRSDLNLQITASRFVPGKACGACKTGPRKTVAPAHWPVETVARVCYACGRVLDYVDDLLLMTPREAVIEFQPRAWAIRRRMAIQPSNAEVGREMILLGLEGGLSPEQVAAELSIEVAYVRNIARAAEIHV